MTNAPQPYPPIAPPRPAPAGGTSSLGIVAIVIGALIALVFVGVMSYNAGRAAGIEATGGRVAGPVAGQPARQVASSVPASKPASVTPPAAPAGPAASFDDGTYEVGVDVAPGTYKATVPSDSLNCYWEREKDLSGSFDSILTNGNVKPGGHVTVTIAASDKGFKSSGCGTWVKTR